MTAQRVFVYDIYNVVHDIFEKKTNRKNRLCIVNCVKNAYIYNHYFSNMYLFIFRNNSHQGGIYFIKN